MRVRLLGRVHAARQGDLPDLRRTLHPGLVRQRLELLVLPVVLRGPRLPGHGQAVRAAAVQVGPRGAQRWAGPEFSPPLPPALAWEGLSVHGRRWRPPRACPQKGWEGAPGSRTPLRLGVGGAGDWAAVWRCSLRGPGSLFPPAQTPPAPRLSAYLQSACQTKQCLDFADRIFSHGVHWLDVPFQKEAGNWAPTLHRPSLLRSHIAGVELVLTVRQGGSWSPQARPPWPVRASC